MHIVNSLLLIHLLTSIQQNVFGGRIINGEIVPDDDMQYMASVQSAGHVCGGFLISEQFVVTAAHCQHNNPKSVILGTHHLDKVDETMRYQIKKCKGPLSDGNDLGRDIMLLKLSRKAPFKPVPLPQPGTKVAGNTRCNVAGWRMTQSHGRTSNDLRVTTVVTISNELCVKIWGKAEINLTKDVICAGGYPTKNGFCQGDSGGPLVCSGKAVGIVSFNYLGNCNYPNLPNVYTSLFKFLSWISRTIETNDC